MCFNQLVSRHAALAAILLAICIGCSDANNGGRSPENTIRLVGAGSTFAAPLYDRWAKEYAPEHDQVVVEYQSIGSSKGVTKFLADEVDFGASDAGLTDEQIVAAPHGAQMLPVAAGCIALAYNVEGVPNGLRLSREAYVGIYLGKVEFWDDSKIADKNPGFKLPHSKIITVVRSEGSGTTFAFTNHLSAISEEWKASRGAANDIGWVANHMGAPGNEGVAGLIKRASDTIGYVEYGVAKRAGLHTATLENKEGTFVAPSGGSGLAALLSTELPSNFRIFMPDPAGNDSYPIITYTWILLRNHADDARRAKAIDHFVKWCLTDGQQFNESLGYVRLPPAVVTKALAIMNARP